MSIDEKWLADVGMPNPSRPSVMLTAILAMSNEAEAAKDPFQRRIALNEMQAAIQAASKEIVALAEGIMLGGDGA